MRANGDPGEVRSRFGVENEAMRDLALKVALAATKGIENEAILLRNNGI
jgi:hypothetical protein